MPVVIFMQVAFVMVIKNCMMNRLIIVACLVLEVLLCAESYDVHGVSVSCMTAYEEGGASAVISSLECPQWFLSAESSQNSSGNCDFASIQGRREYQEDRIACNLEMRLPFSGKDGMEEVIVGIAAIFDGHGGDEASEMASRKLFDYFLLHVVFTAYMRVLSSIKENRETQMGKSFQGTVPLTDHGSLLPILNEALLKTIQEIDSEFSKEALDKGYISGCTAIIVLLVNHQFLIANVGDSKAILCSQRIQSEHHPEGISSTGIYAEELTRDHHPDREDEKVRINAAGGFVRTMGVPRVNGILAVSRSIGDLYLKRYGVIAEPEITGWRTRTPENRYLVLVSDGIFETLSPENVCDLVYDRTSSSQHEPSSSLAEWVINCAFVEGSEDNLSAIVISDFNSTEDRCDEGWKVKF